MKTGAKILIPILGLTALLVFAGIGIGNSKAFGPADHDSLIQKLAERFNLNREEVEEFFEQQKQQHQEEMKAREEERLNQLVGDGKLTQAQKNALIAKREEWRRENADMGEKFRNMSWEERQQVMKEHREEMDKWLEENGIDWEVLREYGPKRCGKRGELGGSKLMK